jgi:DNA-binding CsgD family transcriptional regulator/tetratricopeptide (TPR) repeat protein
VAGDALRLGRESYERRAWSDAYALLSRADRELALGAYDFELLATSAFMVGRDDDYALALERAHRLHLDDGETSRAVRCAFWLGLNHLLRGEGARASGWLASAHRLLDDAGQDVVERGYLLMPVVFQHEAAGEYEEAAGVAGRAVAIAQRFGDPDGFALSLQAQGHMLIKAGSVGEGLALLDEAMVAVTTRDLSPIATGFVYCGVILACQEAFDVRRAQEWTAALSTWCERQPDLVAFTGRCLVHRAEILQFRGEWAEALGEASRASERLASGVNRAAAAQASYRRGEIHRLRGEWAAAGKAYREASRHGQEPQPGIALLRLGQGKADAAAGAIRRALAETSDALQRVSLLTAAIEIFLAAGEHDDARRACSELEDVAGRLESDLLDAFAAHARGAVELAGGDAQAALSALRAALRCWQDLDAPYERARTRELIGIACQAVGDEDSYRLELEAARETFVELRAGPDLARVTGHLSSTADAATSGLTRRELQVLELVASGKTNRAIAADLVISEKTVARHVSNIFAKLGLSTRAAATAYAYEHDLV